MQIESRDSVSLKPVELDEFSQLLVAVGLAGMDEHLESQVEKFPLIVLAVVDNESHGFLFGSLERVGGTPCILWGLGAIRKGKTSGTTLKALVAELYRRAAISFPDEDVLIAGRIAHPATYNLFAQLDDVVPRPNYKATGEERAWGRRLAKRFSCDTRYDEHAFRVKPGKVPEPVLDASTVKGGGKAAVELVGACSPSGGEAIIAFGWVSADALAGGFGLLV